MRGYGKEIKAYSYLKLLIFTRFVMGLIKLTFTYQKQIHVYNLTLKIIKFTLLVIAVDTYSTCTVLYLTKPGLGSVFDHAIFVL